MKKKTEFQMSRDKVQFVVDIVNEQIGILGGHTKELYQSLTGIQYLFDQIRNIPSEQILQYEELKRIRLHWKQQVEKIENDYKNAVAKDAGAGAAGAGLGAAVVAMGPTAAMGIATTFGVASTGTAISALSGAAATNAALAWLGGGALAAGGGGMVAGEALLALAGPVGWTIAGVTLLASGFMFWKNSSDRICLEKVYIAIFKRDEKTYLLANVELNERIRRILDENAKLKEAIERIQTFGLDYNNMTEAQQYELGSYKDLMEASTQLLIMPIEALAQKFTMDDFEKYCVCKSRSEEKCKKYSKVIISLANQLYKINLDEYSQALFIKSMQNNKEFLKQMGISKKEFDKDILNIVLEALNYKYICDRRAE